MGKHILILGVVLGALALVGVTADDATEVSTSKSYLVTTVSQKVTAVYQLASQVNATEKLKPVTEEIPVPIPRIDDVDNPSSQTTNTPDEDNETAKLQKLKRKVLASNLKNISEKVLPSDKYENPVLLKPLLNVTEHSVTNDGDKKDNLPESTTLKAIEKSESITKVKEIVKSQNSVQENGKESVRVKQAKILGSLPQPGNFSVSGRKGTEPPKDQSYEKKDRSQKMLNNYLSNNERYEESQPSSSSLGSNKKPAQLSTDNSLKNAIRFENEYYGPTGQTDWVPIVPDRSLRKPSSSRVNETIKKSSIVFPSDNVQQPKISNVMSFHSGRYPTTVRKRNEGVNQTSQIPVTFPGPVKQKLNSTVPNKKVQTITKGSNMTDNINKEKVEVYKFNTLTTVESATTVKSIITINNTNVTPVTVVTTTTTTSSSSSSSSTSYTKKPFDSADSGLVVPPENVKIENTTKEQQLSTSSLPDSSLGYSGPPVRKINESLVDIHSPLSEESPISIQNTKNVELVNETDVIIPGSVEMIQSNDSTSLLEILKGKTHEAESTITTVSEEDMTTMPFRPVSSSHNRVLNSTAESVGTKNDLNERDKNNIPEPPIPKTNLIERVTSSTENTKATTLKETPNPTTVVTTKTDLLEESNVDDSDMSTETYSSTLTMSTINQDYETETTPIPDTTSKSTSTSSIPVIQKIPVSHKINSTTTISSSKIPSTSAPVLSTVNATTTARTANTTSTIGTTVGNVTTLSDNSEGNNKSVISSTEGIDLKVTTMTPTVIKTNSTMTTDNIIFENVTKIIPTKVVETPLEKSEDVQATSTTTIGPSRTTMTTSTGFRPVRNISETSTESLNYTGNSVISEPVVQNVSQIPPMATSRIPITDINTNIPSPHSETTAEVPKSVNNGSSADIPSITLSMATTPSTTTFVTTSPSTSTSKISTPSTTASTISMPSTTSSTISTPSTTASTMSSTTAFTTTSTSTDSPSTPSTNTIASTSITSTVNVGKPDVDEGIYYKNYIPTTFNPHDEITEENVPAYLRLTVQTASWAELCALKEDLRDAIIRMLGGKNISSESVHFLNLSDKSCQEKIEESRGEETNGTVFLPVNMFLMDKNGDFDKNLSEAFLTLWGRQGLDFELPIRKVDFVTPIVNLTELAEPPLAGSVVAAIVISCVAGICVILLGILFVIMKRRQKRFNYGQRCTPVSLDAYSLDSVSIYNSVRRKGMRASKRSYGNAAFDDPEVPTHPMNFAGLANFSSAKEQLFEEFSIIPQVCPKVEELPEGAETKNRYANVIPLPETRVHLSSKEEDPLSDYINANYVRGLKGAEKLYIACQAPMQSTIEDFWRMVWEQQCKVILMITDLQENGIEKCADYLPPNEVTDNLRLFGDYQVTLKKRDVKEKYIISNLVLKNMEGNLWREVTHLWYLGWPDQGVPSEANSLIAFLIEARSQMKSQNGASTASPTVVHCSPGTGRTGTVIACDLCIREYEQTRMVDIPKCVFNLRRDRAGAVQTKDQYAFIYQVLNVYATKLSGGGIESI